MGKDRLNIMIKSFIVKNYLNEILEFELTNPQESGIAVRSVTGLGPGKSTVNIKEIASNDGGSFSGSRTPVRNIVMNLIFVDEYETIEDIRHKTYKYFPTKKPLTLTVVTDNHILDIEGIVESNEPDIFSDMEGCQISILCANPFFHTKREQITTSSGEEPMFEFPFSNELIENPPVVTNAIPSDFPYITYGDSKIAEYQNKYIKKTPFEHEGVEYVPDDLSGKIPFRAVDSNNQDNSDILPIFLLSFPWNKKIFEEKSNYYLYFSCDTNQISGNSYVNDAIITDWKRVDFKIIVKQNDTLLKSYIILSIYKSSENKKLIQTPIKLEDNIIDNIYKNNSLLSFSIIAYVYGDTDGEVLRSVYPAIYKNGFYIDCLIRDVYIKKYYAEKRQGFSGEEYLIYTWPTTDSFEFELNKMDSAKNLYFDLLKEDMIFKNPDNSWIPNINDNVDRKFILYFQLNFDLYYEVQSYWDQTPKSVSLLLRTYFVIYGGSYIPINLGEFIISKVDATNVESWGRNKNFKIEISEDIYYKLLNLMDLYDRTLIQFQALILYDGTTSNIDGRSSMTIKNFRFYEILQPTKDPTKKIDYLVDESMPNYSFIQNEINYNLRASEGMIMGEIQKYYFNHYVKYEGSKSIGFQMQIEFIQSLTKENDENPGYIIIKSNQYPGKKMVIDLAKISEILPPAKMYDASISSTISSTTNTLDPIGPGLETEIEVKSAQKGDIIFIDTRKKNKSIKYQKPEGVSGLDEVKYYWDYKNKKFNILSALNRDVEWYEIAQGNNVFSIYHTLYPEKEALTDEELEKCHAERLAVQIRNAIYYEGV